MLLAADTGQVTALCLLDLTAAFDKVDHELLMLRLERQFGIRGVAVVSIVQSFRVIYAGAVQRGLYRLLCAARVGARSEPVHPVHGVPSRRRQAA